MYVIGTAGHVDHGKSTLVKALTGIDPDRWEEEKRRQMTIDLGFAWVTLPSGQTISLVDVPGHERFIKNMLAGVGGIDAALLIIAADESVMPQTLEHLAILDLLGIEHGLVVLTKTDLVDADWLALVHDDLDQVLTDTTFAQLCRVAVSARTGDGLAELLAALDQLVATLPARSQQQGIPRLPIDRSFPIDGFGTVVTGTLLGGPLHTGQEVLVGPGDHKARIRGLQVHQSRQEQVDPGSRVAVNLSGIRHHQIERGHLLTLPGAITPTRLIDVSLRVIPRIERPVTHNMALDLFVGAAEVRCRAALLDADVLEPGQTGWVQLRLEQPLMVIAGERFIVRQPSPSLTLGGGQIIDPQPRRHRRFRDDVIASLEIRQRGTPAELLLQALNTNSPCTWADLCTAAVLDTQLAAAGLAELRQQQSVLLLAQPSSDMQADTVLVTAERWHALQQALVPIVQRYHQRFPLRRGMPREELRQRLKLFPRIANAVFIEAATQQLLALNETSVWLVDHTPTPNPHQRQQLDDLLAALAQKPYAPPPPELDAELLAWALDQGLLIRVSPDVCFLPATYEELLQWVIATINEHGSVQLGQFRDRFGSSRKYALALLEHLDACNITRRSGEGRVLAKC
ncbi:MAG: selenocysteine-specific translation elongation factor [Chloroflexaceae bacterium]|nr:selenocysteine-specific translation elongation factor [Chloroflexaceae bacterium]